MDYKVAVLIVSLIIEGLVLIDLFRLVKYKKYKMPWLVTVNDLLIGLIQIIFLIIAFKQISDLQSVEFAYTFLLKGKLQLAVFLLIFSRMVLLEESLKIKD